MKIALYSPYLDTAGGGEKYILTIAEELSKKEQVDILLDKNLFKIGADLIKQKIFSLHGLDLSKTNFVTAPFGKGSSFLERFFFLKKYDWLFYLTDGSIFLSTAKNSVLHFQVPFTKLENQGIWEKIKLSSWNYIIFNSIFTKDIVEPSWSVRGRVIYPPVSVNLFKPLKKKNQIISVGRFFGYLKDKKHELLIDTFKQLNLNNWRLCLVGGATDGDANYIYELKKRVGKSNVDIYPNASLENLIKLYGESSIYWHAQGYGEEDPKKHEHFGITTVEAMAAGCVPIVINSGGQKEIIKNSFSGFLWNDVNELKNLTLAITKDAALRKKISQNAQKESKKFSKEKFVEHIKDIVYKTK